MTPEEAINLLDNLIGMVDDNHDSDYDGALKMAINALEKQEKYKWHDLRKNPEDLPLRGKLVEVLYAYFLRGIQYHEITLLEIYDNTWKALADYDMEGWSGIAWREIEPFEEDE